MLTGLAIRSFLELVGILLITLAILNEDKFIVFEENIGRIIKKKIRARRRRKAMEKKRAAVQNTVRKAIPAEEVPQRRYAPAVYDRRAKAAAGNGQIVA